MSIDWDSVREKFPALAHWTYLNTATYGQVPRRGISADATHWTNCEKSHAATLSIGTTMPTSSERRLRA